MIKQMIRKFSYSVDDYYKAYKGKLSKKEFKHILVTYCEFMFEKMLEGYQVKLPGELGYLEFWKKIHKAIDWKVTKQLYNDHNQVSDDKKRIYNRNDHTDGYVVITIWYRKFTILKRKSFFKFVLARRLKKELSKRLKDGTVNINNFNNL